MIFPKEVDHYKLGTVPDLVPEKPGIYAWYYNYSHLKDFMGDRRLLIDEIELISQKLNYPSLKGVVKGVLGRQYKTEMISINRLKLTDTKNKLINNMEEDEIMNLIGTLNNFASPLYIGVSNELKTRYKNHLEDYRLAAGNSDIEKNCFGYRLNEMGVALRHLTYKYIELDRMSRDNIETIEFVANRLFKPIVGRK